MGSAESKATGNCSDTMSRCCGLCIDGRGGALSSHASPTRHTPSGMRGCIGVRQIRGWSSDGRSVEGEGARVRSRGRAWGRRWVAASPRLGSLGPGSFQISLARAAHKMASHRAASIHDRPARRRQAQAPLLSATSCDRILSARRPPLARASSAQSRTPLRRPGCTVARPWAPARSARRLSGCSRTTQGALCDLPGG